MAFSPVNRIILFTGFIGLLNSTLRFLVPLSLVFFGWNLSQYTTVFVFQALAMGIPLLIGGFSTDLKGRKDTIIASIGLFVIGTLSFFYFIAGTSIWPIVVAQMLSTISFGIARSSLSILIADETAIGFHRTNSLGKQATARNTGGLIGPIILGALLQFWSIDFPFISPSVYEGAYLVLSIFSLFGIGLALTLPSTSSSQITANRNAKLADFTSSQIKMTRAFGIEEIIMGFTSGLIVPLIDFYVLTEFEPSDLLWSIIFGLSNSGIALGSFLVGRYAEKVGKANLVLLLNIVAPFFALGIALAPSFSLAGIFYVARSSFANSVQPAWEAWFFVHTPVTVRGRSMSTIQLSRRLSRAFGVASGPFLFSILGTAVFPLGCVFYPFAMEIPRSIERKMLTETSNSTDD